MKSLGSHKIKIMKKTQLKKGVSTFLSLSLFQNLFVVGCMLKICCYKVSLKVRRGPMAMASREEKGKRNAAPTPPQTFLGRKNLFIADVKLDI